MDKRSTGVIIKLQVSRENKGFLLKVYTAVFFGSC